MGPTSLQERPEPVQTDPDELDEELLRAEWAVQDATDLYHLARYTLTAQFPNQKLAPQPHADVCDFLTNGGKYAGKLKNRWKLLLNPRGTLKSAIATFAYPIWLLLRDPNTRILIDSETYEKSQAFIGAIKGAVTTNDRFLWAHGNLSRPLSQEAQAYAKDNNGRLPWSDEAIMVGTRTNFSRKEASIEVGGLDVARTGYHFDVVIGDDYHGPKNTQNKEQIAKVIKHIQRMTAILDPNTQYVIVGTRWDDKDAYGWIINDLEGLRITKPGVYRGQFFDIMVYPWRVGTPAQDEVPDAETHCYRSCTYFAPQIHNEESIKPIRAMHTPYDFAAQYGNDPIDEASAAFETGWIRHNVVLPKDLPLDEMLVFMSIDPATGQRSDSDYRAIVTEGFDIRERRFLLDVNHGRWREEKFLDEIFATYRKFRPLGVQIVGFEAVSGFKAFEALISNRMKKERVHLPMFYFPQDTRVSGETRIRALAPVFRDGSFYTVAGCRGLEEFWEEYRRYPKSRHDDVLSCLADIERFKYFPREYEERPEDSYRPLDEATGY